VGRPERVAVKSPLAERGAEAVPRDEREAALLPLALTRAEAVALASRYASPEAAAFVNGIISAAARTRGKGR
jgi:hypothetical protein